MYIASVLASIYDKLISEIVLVDDISHVTYPLNTRLRISASQREQHINTKYDVLDDNFIIIEKINHTYIEHYPIDYVFIYGEREYIVPFEVLDQDNKIAISELNIWTAKT